MNRLIYYPTGSYGTFLQWLCNTTDIAGVEDLPFHADGNSHKYVLSDQYKLLISNECEFEFVSSKNPNVVSCIWPIDHNGKLFNKDKIQDGYHQINVWQLNKFYSHDIKILVIYPTETSKIWWYHNNYKKVFYTPEMFDKKIKHRYSELPWLTCNDTMQRVRLQMDYYSQQDWYQSIINQFNCKTVYDLSLGQLRVLMAQALHEESFDCVSNWTKLSAEFPNIKFITLDDLRDNFGNTVLNMFEFFNVNTALKNKIDYIHSEWQPLQTTMHRDALHRTIINCIVNGQAHDWSDTTFDLFDEAYLLSVLKFQHGIDFAAHTIEKLPTNTQDLLRLAS